MHAHAVVFRERTDAATIAFTSASAIFCWFDYAPRDWYAYF
jgi:hypothetical protein